MSDAPAAPGQGAGQAAGQTPGAAAASDAERQALTHETLWRHVRRLVDRAFVALEKDLAVDECLDLVVDLLGADRGMVLLRQADGGMQVINARGHKRALAAEEREEMSRTIVRRALEQDECIVWDPAAAPSTSSSFAMLRIVAALAAPLRGGRPQPLGVLYVDFRNPRLELDERRIEFFMTAAALFGAMLDQHESARTDREHLREVRSLFVESRHMPTFDQLLSAPSMAGIRQDVTPVLTGDAPILILGESGTGKTILAQAIAEASGRRPIVRAVLGASDDLNTITSELFGHERGAYSGAAGKRIGLVEYANGGTLILDEILNLPPHAQQILLDFSQFGSYRPLGYEGAEPKRARVRIIAATNGDIRAAMHERRFRQDLYYRLAGVTIDLPPLRARREDIPALAEATLRRVDGARPWTLSLSLRRLLVSPSITWSGNVRQLEHAIERARERATMRDREATVLLPEHLASRDIDGAAIETAASKSMPPGAALALGDRWQKVHADRATLEELEKDVLRQALAEAGGIVAHAARALGVARTTLASRLEALAIRAAKGPSK
jgi:transcriptional regulator with GAF, ATPase, and Fis domain